MSSRGVNKAIIIGNIGQDPVIKEFNNGKMVAISVATSETWSDKKTGDLKTDTQWHRVVFFNKLADIAAQYLHKGSKVYIEGSMKTRKYEKDGYEHSLTEIIASNMQMLDGKKEESGNRDNYQAKATAELYAPSNDFDDDVPF